MKERNQIMPLKQRVGALLLTLPIASRDGQSAGFFTGLFTATSSSCVTGLILVDTWTQWTLFGQVVILAMIQLGGLGFMTVVSLISFALHRRIGLSERLIMVSTLNLDSMDGVVRVVRHALIGTFAMEASVTAPGLKGCIFFSKLHFPSGHMYTCCLSFVKILRPVRSQSNDTCCRSTGKHPNCRRNQPSSFLSIKSLALTP